MENDLKNRTKSTNGTITILCTIVNFQKANLKLFVNFTVLHCKLSQTIIVRIHKRNYNKKRN